MKLNSETESVPRFWTIVCSKGLNELEDGPYNQLQRDAAGSERGCGDATTSSDSFKCSGFPHPNKLHINDCEEKEESIAVINSEANNGSKLSFLGQQRRKCLYCEEGAISDEECLGY